MDEIESWPCDSSEYSLEHLIGRGSFAKVYTATCAKKRSDGVQRVALKVMDLEHINTEIADIYLFNLIAVTCRDAHDTFFISEPAETTLFEEDYLEKVGCFLQIVDVNMMLKVKKIHSEGGWGSQGYGYNWKREEAAKNLLRTHTTAVSARMLYRCKVRSPFA